MKTSKSHSRMSKKTSLMKQFRSVHVENSQNIILNLKQKEQQQPKNVEYSREFVEDLIRKVYSLEDKQKQIETKFLFYVQKLQSEIDLKQQVNQNLRSEISSLKNTLFKIQSNLQSFVKTNQIQAIRQKFLSKSPMKKSSPLIYKQNLAPYSIKNYQMNKNLSLNNAIPRIQISLTERNNPNELSEFQIQQQTLKSRRGQYRNDDYELKNLLLQNNPNGNNIRYIQTQRPSKSPKNKTSRPKIIGSFMKSKQQFIK